MLPHLNLDRNDGSDILNGIYKFGSRTFLLLGRTGGDVQGV
jgi:hypothetical protein